MLVFLHCSEQTNYRFDLLKEYVPNSFKLLSPEESSEYLPELNQSMLVRNAKFFSRHPTQTEWKKWDRFEGQCIQG